MTFYLHLLRLLLALLPIGSGGSQPECSPAQNVTDECGGWALVWHEEFSNNASFSNWSLDLGDGTEEGSRCISSCCTGDSGWGNGEKQVYVNTSDAVRIDGDNLHITASGDWIKGYKSARLVSKHAFSYGALAADAAVRIEARIYVPAAGNTIWPAFWLLPRVSDVPKLWSDAARCTWPHSGEIDVMEYQSLYWTSYNTLHFARPPSKWGGNHDFISHATPLDAATYHRFGVEYNRTMIKWDIDGRETFRIDSDNIVRSEVGQAITWCPFKPHLPTTGGDDPFQVVLNLAIGGGFLNGLVYDDNLPQTMSVDWVRAYVKHPNVTNHFAVESGCTRVAANNHNPDAVVDDGSCTYTSPPAPPGGPPPPASPPELPPPKVTEFKRVGSRVRVVGRAMYVDGNLFSMRGICYSPVPFGHDPGYHEPHGDYFTTTYKPIFERDIKMFKEMGANTIRLYTLKRSRRHFEFLDMAYAEKLVVVGAFEMGNAVETPIKTETELEAAKVRLRGQIRASIHPAFIMWLVGNELNGAWLLFVCEDDYALKLRPGSKTTLKYKGCMFGDDIEELGRRVNSLCEVVNVEGLLCSTPLAGVNPPPQYLPWDDYVCPGAECPANPYYSSGGWMKVWGPVTPNLDVWSLNSYPGANFTAMNFDILDTFIDRPIVISEVGVDAFDSYAERESNINRETWDIDKYGDRFYLSETNTFFRGAPGEFATGDWVLTLVEDLERYSMTCVGPQCKLPIASGISLMAWVDELWKGRVEDSSDSNPLMDEIKGYGLCPDKGADIHSPCGYPSGAQPDRIVNEEWFGLNAIYRVCKGRDQLRPRAAWFQLKRVWALGGCVQHRGDLLSGPQTSFNATDYPSCAHAITLLRGAVEAIPWGTNNYSDGISECDYQRSVFEQTVGGTGNVTLYTYGLKDVHRVYWNTSTLAIERGLGGAVCPAPGSHWYNGSLELLIKNWTDRYPDGYPEGCKLHDVKDFPWCATTGFCEEKPLETNTLMFLIVLAFIGIICLRRLKYIPQSISKSMWRQWSWGSCKRVVVMQAVDNHLEKLLTPVTLPNTQALLRRGASGVSATQVAGIKSALRQRVAPIAACLVGFFGFQRDQEATEMCPEPVKSNEGNTVDNITHLLSNTVLKSWSEGIPINALVSGAVDELYNELMANFHRWLEHHSLKASWAHMKVSEQPGCTQARLSLIVLNQLIYGEAANLRQLPEYLCLLLYACSDSLKLRNDSGSSLEIPEIRENELLPIAGSFLERAISPIYSFLQHEVATRKNDPIEDRVMYDDVNEAFWDVRTVKALLPEDGSTDGNLFEHICLSLSGKDSAVQRRGQPSAHVGLERYLKKTYREVVTQQHAYFCFRRVYSFNAVLLTLCASAVFEEKRANDDGDTFRVSRLLTCVVTQSVFDLWFCLCEIIVKPFYTYSVRSIMRLCASFFLQATTIMLYGAHVMSGPELSKSLLLYVLPSELGWLSGGQVRLFDVWAFVYFVLMIFGRFVPLFSSSSEYLGRRKDMWNTLSWRAVFTYSAFWMVVLGTKFIFNYYIISQMVSTSLTLWEDPALGSRGLYCWDYDKDETNEQGCVRDNLPGMISVIFDPETSSFDVEMPSSYLGIMTAYRTVRAYYFRILLLSLRWAVPIMLVFADIVIWYTMWSTLASVIYGLRVAPSRITDWAELIRALPSCVALLNTKIVSEDQFVRHIGATAARVVLGADRASWEKLATEARIRAMQGVALSYEGISLEWQFFSRVWNSIILALRHRDIISDKERNELSFYSISSKPHGNTNVVDQCGLTVAEYTILPAMLLSPAFLPSLWVSGTLQRYDHFGMALIQVRDITMMLLTRIGVIDGTYHDVLREACAHIGELVSRLWHSYSFDIGKLQNTLVDAVRKLHALSVETSRVTFTRARNEQASDEVTTKLTKLGKDFATCIQNIYDTLDSLVDVANRTHLEVSPSEHEAIDRVKSIVNTSALQSSKGIKSIAVLLSTADAQILLKSLLMSVTTANPGAEPLDNEVSRQLFEFCNSLFHKQLSRPPSTKSMRSVSLFTPYYAEDVKKSLASLQQADYVQNTSALRTLIALFPHQWQNLIERSGMHAAERDGEGPRTELARAGKSYRDGEVKAIHDDIEQWAADREQTLSRTICSGMLYADALRLLTRLEGTPEGEVEDVVSLKFEYVVTCQIYGKQKYGDEADPAKLQANRQKAVAIDQMMKRYPNSIKVAYVDQTADGRVYSKLIEWDHARDDVKTAYQVQLPGNPIIGEGKPENQNHAIIFTRGHYLQTLDMNQESYPAEAFKLRNLLECFVGSVRIVGFQENIFSTQVGAVASFAASNEFVFGTITQRFMTYPLKVRFHYGHPDVWDKIWVQSNGGVSKSSKTLHISEDVFGGINCVLRGGQVDYVEFISVGKGRDVTLTGISGFDKKIAGGNAFQLMSRDYHRLASSCDFIRCLSLFASGPGTYLSNATFSWALYWYVIAQMTLAATRREVFFEDGLGFDFNEELGDEHIYEAAFLYQLGFILMLPLLLNRWAKHGLPAALNELSVHMMALKPIFSIFQARTSMYYLESGLRTGQADYVATGRTLDTLTANFTTIFATFARSHFTFAFEIISITVLYRILTAHPAYFVLLTWTVWLYCAAMLTAPWLFNPQSFSGVNLLADFVEFLCWLDEVPGIQVGDGSWCAWHRKHMAPLRKCSLKKRVFLTLGRDLTAIFVIFTAACAALVVDDFAPPKDINDPGQLAIPHIRELLLMKAGGIFICVGLLLYFLTDYHFIQKPYFWDRDVKRGVWMVGFVQNCISYLVTIIGQRTLFCLWRWVMRFLCLAIYTALAKWAVYKYLGPRGASCDVYHIHYGYDGRSEPCDQNWAILVVAGCLWQAVVVQLIAITRQPKNNFWMHHLHQYSDFWFREVHELIGTLLYLVIFAISFLPVFSLHAVLLFNQDQASNYLRVRRRTQLLRALYSVVIVRISSILSFFMGLLATVWRVAMDIIFGVKNRPAQAASLTTRYSILDPCTSSSSICSQEGCSPRSSIRSSIGTQESKHALLTDSAPDEDAGKSPLSQTPTAQIQDSSSQRSLSPNQARLSEMSNDIHSSLKASFSHSSKASSKPSLYVEIPTLSPDVEELVSPARQEQNKASLKASFYHSSKASSNSSKASSKPSLYVEIPTLYPDVEELVSPARQEQNKAREYAPLCSFALQDASSTMYTLIPSDLPRRLNSIGVHLRRVFGFQVNSNGDPNTVDLVVDNLCVAIENQMWRFQLESHQYSLTGCKWAIDELHRQTMANYIKWVNYIQMDITFDPRMVTVGSLTSSAWESSGLFCFETALEEEEWRCNAQLHQLVLWNLVCYEAANLRLMPEVLAFIFHCAALSVLLPTTMPSADNLDDTLSAYVPRGSSMPYAAGDYSSKIVGPIYTFLSGQMQVQKGKHTGTHVLYDDVNESFWYKDNIAALVNAGVEQAQLYSVMRDSLSDSGILDKAFVKLFVEAVSWTHLVHIYWRYFMQVTLMLHGCLVFAFAGWNYAAIATITISHALWIITAQVVIMLNPSASAQLERANQSSARRWHLFVAVSHLIVPAVFIVESIVTSNPPPHWWTPPLNLSTTPPSSRPPSPIPPLSPPPDWPPAAYDAHHGSSHGSAEHDDGSGYMQLSQTCALIYTFLHLLHEVVHTRPGVLLRSTLMSYSHPYIGDHEDLAVDIYHFAAYAAFWCFTWYIKIKFGFDVLITPLVDPVISLWSLEDKCWAGDAWLNKGLQFCKPRVAGAVGEICSRPIEYQPEEAREFCETLPFFKAQAFMLIAVRCAVPVITFFVDPFIFFSACSAVSSLLLGIRQRIGRKTRWMDVVNTLEECVHEFHQKMINPLNRGEQDQPWSGSIISNAWRWMLRATAPRPTPAQSDDGFSIEACSQEWQVFAYAWNHILRDLRSSDLLSNNEFEDLKFNFLSGPKQQSIFGVTEYVIFPVMLTSPALCSAAVSGSLLHNYPSFQRTLLQLRDLLCWLLLQLGMLSEDETGDFLRVLTALARFAGKLRDIRRQGDSGGLNELRCHVVSLLHVLQDVHRVLQVEADEHAKSRKSKMSVTASSFTGSLLSVATASERAQRREQAFASTYINDAPGSDSDGSDDSFEQASQYMASPVSASRKGLFSSFKDAIASSFTRRPESSFKRFSSGSSSTASVTACRDSLASPSKSGFNSALASPAFNSRSAFKRSFALAHEFQDSHAISSSPSSFIQRSKPASFKKSSFKQSSFKQSFCGGGTSNMVFSVRGLGSSIEPEPDSASPSQVRATFEDATEAFENDGMQNSSFIRRSKPASFKKSSFKQSSFKQSFRGGGTSNMAFSVRGLGSSVEPEPDSASPSQVRATFEDATEASENDGMQNSSPLRRVRATFEDATEASGNDGMQNSSPLQREMEEYLIVLRSLIESIMEAVVGLFEHQRTDAESQRRTVETFRRLRRLIRIDTLTQPDSVDMLKSALLQPEMGMVIASLIGSMTAVNPGAEPKNSEAQRQLIFMSNSLQMPQLKRPPSVWEMKSLSVFTPHFAEDVGYSMAALTSLMSYAEVEDRINLFHLLKSIYPDEWDNFAERQGVNGSFGDVTRFDEQQLLAWASDRGQTLSRTVRGVCKHAEAIGLLGRLEGVDFMDLDRLISCKFEFVVAAQKYGDFCISEKEPEKWHKKGIEKLMEQHAGVLRVAYVHTVSPCEVYSVLIAWDPALKAVKTLYRVRLPGNPILGEGKPENQNHAVIFTRGQYLQTLDMNQDYYMGEALKARQLLECFVGHVRIVGFREHIFSESAGAIASFAAANEFVFGTLTQRFMATPLKVRFHYGHPDVWDKVWVMTNGGVSKASKTLHISEDIFGGFNCLLRGGAIEYVEFITCGKGRDMTFIAINGFETKVAGGNAMQLLSRDVQRLAARLDIFRLTSFFCSGHGFYFNSWLITAAIKWFVVSNLVILLSGVDFNANYLFNSDPGATAFKIAQTAGHRMLSELDTTSSNHTNSTLLYHECIAAGFTPVACAGVPSTGSLYDVLDGGVTATEAPIESSDYTLAIWSSATFESMYLIQMGFALMFPLFLEVCLEKTFLEGLFVLAKATSVGLMFYVFSMRTKAYHFAFSLTFGNAAYIATGRGFDMETHSLVQLFSIYAASHIYPAVDLMFLLYVYMMYQFQSTVSILTTWSTWIYAFSLWFAPWVYLSHGSTFMEIGTSFCEMVAWSENAPVGNSSEGFGGWDNFHAKRMEAIRKLNRMAKVRLMFLSVLPRALTVYAMLAGVRLNFPTSPIHPLGGNTANGQEEIFILDSPKDWLTKIFIMFVAVSIALSVFIFYTAVLTLAPRILNKMKRYHELSWSKLVFMVIGFAISCFIGCVLLIDATLDSVYACNDPELAREDIVAVWALGSIESCFSSGALLNQSGYIPKPLVHFYGSTVVADDLASRNERKNEGFYNAWLIIFVSVIMLGFLIQLLGILAYPPHKPRKSPTRTSLDSVRSSTNVRSRLSVQRRSKNLKSFSCATMCQAVGLQIVSNMGYRHLDLLIGLIITAVLFLIRVLPMNFLRMMLVYNHEFASKVLKVAERRRTFLNALLFS